MSVLPLIITDAGIAAAVSQDGQGLDLSIVKIALGSGDWSPTSAATGLNSQIKELDAFGATVLSGDRIHVTLRDDSADTYDLREIGLIDENGNLFAIYAQSTPLISKAADAKVLITAVCPLTAVPPASVTITGNEFDYNPATETLRGIIEIADQSEVDVGNDHERAVTSKTLSVKLANYFKKAASNVLTGLNIFTVTASQDVSGAAGSNHEIRQHQADGDAFQTFHIDSVYGVNFGLCRTLKDLVVGGWSKSGQKFRVWHQGNHGRDSGLDADKLRGYIPNVTPNPDTLVQRDGTGRCWAAHDSVVKATVSHAHRSFVDAAGVTRAMIYWNKDNGFLYNNYYNSSGALSGEYRFDGVNIYVNNSKVWNSSNDGAGSGLDADLLDGAQRSHFWSGDNCPYNDSYHKHANGHIDMWASGEVYVGSAVGSVAEFTVWLPIAVPFKFLDVQYSQAVGTDSEASEVSIGLIAQGVNFVGLRVRRIAGSSSGSDRVKVNVRALCR